MKVAGVVAFGMSVALAVLIAARQAAYDDRGSVWSDGYWIVHGPKGENSPEPLPPDLAAVARSGDEIEWNMVWSPDLGLRFERLVLVRAGQTLGRSAPGRTRYYIIVGAIVSAPVGLWGLGVLVAALRPRAKGAVA